MSGPSGRERQPDPAALDELGRAFAEGDDASPTHPVSPPTPPDRPAPDAASETPSPDPPASEAASETPSPDPPAPEGTPERTPSPDTPVPDAASQTPSPDTPAPDAASETPSPDIPAPEVASETPSPDTLTPEVASGTPSPDTLTPEVASETPSPETPSGEAPAPEEILIVEVVPADPTPLDVQPPETPSPEAAPPQEILIVEAVPADSTPPPKIIRIDDYGGSVVIGDAPAAAEPGPPAGEGESGETDTDLREPVVIAIDDEDLPDPVYVEGSLDGSGSRSIVFIEDDDTDDALLPESERDIRRGIEPRMRERRVAVKRARSRKRLKWVLVIAGLVFLVVGTLAVLGSGWFAIEEDQVFVTGNVYTDPEQLQAVIDDLVGTPVLVADTQAAERRLEEIPWVENARVRTEFPHGVTIEIRERQAIATYQGPDERFRVLDRHGRVLDVIDKYPFAYVLLGGPDPVDLDAGQFAPYGYAAAADLSKNLTGSIRGQVELIEVDANGSRLVLHLDDGVEVRFGEARDLLVKLVRLETVLSAGGVSEAGVIDVSTSQVTL